MKYRYIRTGSDVRSRDINIRATYQINVLGIKTEEDTDFLPKPEYCFTGTEHLMILGRKEDVASLLEKM